MFKRKLPQNVPSFLIIGAQKAGTTTLFDILDHLKPFQGSVIKEIHFFDQDENFKKEKIGIFHFLILL